MTEFEAFAAKFRRLIELRERRDIAEAAKKRAENEYRAYEAELFQELEESPLTGSQNIDLGPPYGKVRFTPRTTFYGRIINQQDALNALEAEGELEALTSPQIVKRRLSELVRDRLENNRELPAGIDFYAKRSIGISGNRPKGQDESAILDDIPNNTLEP